MDDVLTGSSILFFIVYVLTAVFALYCFITGLIAAFSVHVFAGVISFFIAPLATLNGLGLLFGYDLMRNLALAIHLI
jgi:hypothetical protein